MNIFEDLNLVRAFVNIVERGSISAAARHMGLKQPTLSRYLKALEERSGTQLLYRDTHRMQLSTAGQQFLEDARSILALAEEAEERLNDDQSKIQGHMRLFSTVDFGQSVVTQLIASFVEVNPKITIELGYSNRPIYMLEEGCDIGIIAGDILDDTVIALTLKHIKRSVYASPSFVNEHGCPNKLEELDEFPWLELSGRQFHAKKKVRFVSSAGIEKVVDVPSPVFISEGVTSLREAASMGFGITILPDWLASEYLAKNKLIRIFEDWRPESIPANIVYPVQRHRSKRVRRFIEFSESYMNAILVT